MNLRIIFFLFSLLIAQTGFTNTSSGDSISLTPRNNFVFATVGIWPTYITLLGSYERAIINPKKSIFSTMGIRISAGYAKVWSSSKGGNFASDIYTLIGRRNNYLDIGIGLLLAPWTSSNKYELFPSFNLSYRHQKADKPYVFRAGIGWPEAPSASDHSTPICLKAINCNLIVKGYCISYQWLTTR